MPAKCWRSFVKAGMSADILSAFLSADFQRLEARVTESHDKIELSCGLLLT